MKKSTSSLNPISTRGRRPWLQLITVIEVALIYGAILFYIWRWQFTYPRAWIVLLACVLVSHLPHRDRLSSMGLTIHGLRDSAQVVLPLALALFVPAVIYGFANGDLLVIPLGPRVVAAFAMYALWCLFQQYLMQSYFHNRLMEISANRHLTSSVVALMFGGAHLPNPILTVATTLGGFLLAEIFARYRNIFPLALAQTVGGFLVAALSPASLIHNMRVGPGYFFVGLN